MIGVQMSRVRNEISRIRCPKSKVKSQKLDFESRVGCQWISCTLAISGERSKVKDQSSKINDQMDKIRR